MMTRDEFMAHAKEEIENAFRGQRNRMMNLVEQAWAEGKRNAEVEAMSEAIRDAFKATPFIVQPQPTWIPGTTHPEYPTITPTITCDGTKPPETHFSGEGT